MRRRTASPTVITTTPLSFHKEYRFPLEKINSFELKKPKRVKEVSVMTDYQKMYTTLFNAVTDALEKMEVQNYGDAKELLISAQQKTEEIYITAQN